MELENLSKKLTQISFWDVHTSTMSLDASSRRLMKELQQLSTEPPTGIVVNKDAASSDLKQWRVDVIGAAGTLYEGEKFSLQFRFTQQYPFNSPEVMFVGENIPVHPHVYSNGHICLSILSEDWTPALSVQAVCLSILSMLSSAREKVLYNRSDHQITHSMFEPATRIPARRDGGSTTIMFNSDTAYVIFLARLLFVLFSNGLLRTTNIKACDRADIVRTNPVRLSTLPSNQ
ncbi:ubiquitin--protein ligase [Ancylostoma caninum]|uniref:Ubiquitin--protein ligase n=1 Tax=Ancylostoma caninum TaxID=29170 RepID=A0A368GWA7_ANCCA|nr:ubiquitin--protein ligase [Ancylostoma caninum]